MDPRSRISDVATVELGVESYDVVTRFERQSECALITLYQAPGTNAVDLASQVIAAMDELKGGFPRRRGL
jgi:HAE1 family hydrophobic/amphiphilic exporter-1